LEYSDESFAIAHNEVVRFGVQAETGKLEISCASVALLALEKEGLVETFGHIDV